MLEFVRRLIQLRSDYPLLHQDRFVHGEEQFEPSGFCDIQWLRSDGEVMQDADWHNSERNVLGMLLAANGAAASKPSQRIEKASALVIVFNADPASVEFSLPPSDYHWHCVFSTADTEVAVTECGSVAIEPRSVQLFELLI